MLILALRKILQCPLDGNQVDFRVVLWRLVENSAVLRLVAKLCIELYIAVVLVSNSPY
jgi:hypothetical protein